MTAKGKEPSTKRKRKPPTASKAASSGNGQKALLDELFQAAIKLRGSIEPPDYKRYVLPIIFLRFLSVRYEKRRAELSGLIEDRKSDYYGLSQVLDDPDEYRLAGVFPVPKEARWDAILKLAPRDDIKKKLDDVLELLEKKYPDKLRGLLPRIYGGSNLDAESLRGLITLFSKDVFAQDHGGLDLIGGVYQYFIGEFANSEGKRGGEYFTPLSIVRTLVAMLEPEEGVVLDPCCGSGGMFVQSDVFAQHSRRLSFVGQESKEFTYRLCRMNLFIHGIDGNIQPGNSYFDDKHAAEQADFVLANPPFNDGAKGEEGWGADRIKSDDPRRALGNERLPLSPRNANTMWILHFLYHLKQGGTAGFVMATGELSNGENARYAVRKALVEQGYVDAIVQLTGQLFANTQIPCSLWFISKNRDGANGMRPRKGEVLFIDGRRLGSLIPGSRKQKQLSEEEIEKVASVYRTYKRKRVPDEVPGFCRAASIDEIRQHDYALTPGRYVGAPDGDEDDEPFEEKFPLLVKQLEEQFATGAELEKEIRANLKRLDLGGPAAS